MKDVRSEQNESRRNVLLVLSIIQRFSVPGMYGQLTIQFEDGKLRDHERIVNTFFPGGSVALEATVRQKGKSDQEIQKLLEAIFSGQS